MDLVILGTGGNCLDMLDIVDAINGAGTGAQYTCAGFLDDNPALHGSRIQGIPVLGSLHEAAQLRGCAFVNGIGSTRNFRDKKSIIAKTGLDPDDFVTLVHPSATVSRSSSLGRGTVLFPHVFVGAGAQIGAHVLVLSNSVISHHARVEDYAIIASGVCLSGATSIGSSSYLGTNSAVMEHVSLGSGCLVGMGAVVRHDVPDEAVVAGNPATRIR